MKLFADYGCATDSCNCYVLWCMWKESSPFGFVFWSIYNLHGQKPSRLPATLPNPPSCPPCQTCQPSQNQVDQADLTNLKAVVHWPAFALLPTMPPPASTFLSQKHQSSETPPLQTPLIVPPAPLLSSLIRCWLDIDCFQQSLLPSVKLIIIIIDVLVVDSYFHHHNLWCFCNFSK